MPKSRKRKFKGSFLHRHLFVIPLVIAVVAGLYLHISAQAQKNDCMNDVHFSEVRGLGRACKMANGLFKVKLKNGKELITHGPDKKNADHLATPKAPPTTTQTTTATTTSTTYRCADSSDYHTVLLYAHPYDKSNNYNGKVDVIKNAFVSNQNQLNAEAETFGVSASYKVKCNPDGTLFVDSVLLDTVSTTSASFGSIVENLQALGYSAGNVKYQVYYDNADPFICGVAGLYGDDRLVEDNNNMTYGGYAIVWDCDYGMHHELLHTLGAVQLSAPHSSGGWHCNDGKDVMCYPDGASNSNYSDTICNDKTHVDCNNDDYFHPNPAEGSYLDTHWNVASCLNRYIYRTGCSYSNTAPPTAPTSLRTKATANSITISWGASTDDVGVIGYRVYISAGDTWQLLTTTSSLSYTHSNLARKTTHTYQVTAIDANDNESTPAQISAKTR